MPLNDKICILAFDEIKVEETYEDNSYAQVMCIGNGEAYQMPFAYMPLDREHTSICIINGFLYLILKHYNVGVEESVYKKGFCSL